MIDKLQMKLLNTVRDSGEFKRIYDQKIKKSEH